MIKRLKFFSLCVLLLTFPTFAFAAKTHRVKKNETLYSLAKKYRISAEELKSANNLVGDKIKPKDLLIIPSRTVAGASTSGSVYKVKKNESLAKIAKKTGFRSRS